MRKIYEKRSMHALAFFVMLLITVVSSCSNDDPPLPDNVASFQSGELGLATDEESIEVKISLTRPVSSDVLMVVSFEGEGVVYEEDFIITPEPVGNSVQLIISGGSSEAKFVIAKKADALFDGDEKIKFTVASTSPAIVIGTQDQLVLSFSEIRSLGSVLDLDGGGALYSKKVFIDFSANRQTAVNRDAWDLGFYMEGGDFHVILNSSVTMMARALDKTDINDVTAQDTLGFRSAMVLASAAALPWIDDPTGDLSKTAIASISDNAGENKVYILNRGSGIGTPGPSRGWKKIRILRNGTGYALQHADIASTTFSEIQITREEGSLFKHVLFETGVVDAEPARSKWDIAWTYFVNTTVFGQDVVPYAFQDVVLQNRYGVETARVLTDDVGYEEFSESDLTGLTFSNSQIAIGSDWRRTSPSPAIVYDDRFYVVKDASGNYYKLKFNFILRDGVRGNPQLEYALVKTAE